MTTLARTSASLEPHLIFWLDAAGSLVFGLALIFAAAPLTSLFGWSVPPTVLLCIGLFLLPWAFFNLAIARSSKPASTFLAANLIGDGIWILGSVLLMLAQAAQFSTAGWVLMVGQTAAVSLVLALKLVSARAFAD
jgi:xanthine/uracil permease